MKKIIIRVAVIVPLLVAMLLASTMLVAYTDRAFICENTGSRMGYREWFLGAKTQEWYRKSELEKFMEEKYSLMLRHRWTSYAGTGRSLIPVLIIRGHGRPGPILLLDSESMDEHVRTVTDEQRLELYQTFSRADVEVAREKIVEILEESAR